jgi:mycothiol synthase
VEAQVLGVVASVDPSAPDEVRDLLARHTAARGHAGLSEGRLRALDAAVGAPGPLVAVAARRADDGTLIGWAQVDDGGDGRDPTLEVVALGDDGGDDGPLLERLVDAALAAPALGRGAPIRWWVSHASDTDDGRAAARGFHVERDLLQMRCPLPLPGRDDRVAHPHVATRAFRVGTDESGWLVQNNRAFADHPEQGHWDLPTLQEREGEAWFDPDGFRVLEVDGRIAGSCWTKVHATRPPLGEVYVIGVDPDFHGRGWGRALTEAGFDWLAGAGLAHGMLYVDAANAPAVSLYRSMGLTTHHVDRAYVRGPDPG